MKSKANPEYDLVELCKNTATKRLPVATGRTLQEIVSSYQRRDGDTGLRVREMTHAMHVAAETLKTALDEPERFSMASIFGLADLMGVPPGMLIADIFHQVSVREMLGLLQGRRQPRARPKTSSPEVKAGHSEAASSHQDQPGQAKPKASTKTNPATRPAGSS